MIRAAEAPVDTCLPMLDDADPNERNAISCPQSLRGVCNTAVDWANRPGVKRTGLLVGVLFGACLLYVANRDDPKDPEGLVEQWWPGISAALKEAFVSNVTRLASACLPRHDLQGRAMPEHLRTGLMKLIDNLDASRRAERTMQHLEGGGFLGNLDFGTRRDTSGNRAASMWSALERADRLQRES